MKFNNINPPFNKIEKSERGIELGEKPKTV